VKHVDSYLHLAEHGGQEPDPAPGPYYVSAVDGARFALLLGPFRTHAEALGWVGSVQQVAMQVARREAVWAAFGTCRVRDDYTIPGKLNGVEGLPDPRW
jgi:hypothetical protein